MPSISRLAEIEKSDITTFGDTNTMATERCEHCVTTLGSDLTLLLAFLSRH